jgi:hypothetical protein
MALLQKAYLGATPLFRETAWFEDNAFNIIDAPALTILTANTNAHTKGAWQEILASSSANASLLVLQFSAYSTNATNTATLIDIATGASGSETVILSNIAVGSAEPTTVDIPIKIASGTRLSARIQSVVTGGKTGRVQPVLVDVGDYATAPTSVDVIGGDPATSRGISFSGSSGTWVEAIASTTRNYRGVAAVFSAHDDTIAAIIGNMEIGIGSAGNEVSIGTIRMQYTTAEIARHILPFNSLFGYNIPSGSRLAVKHFITANPERYGFTLVGIP